MGELQLALKEAQREKEKLADELFVAKGLKGLEDIDIEQVYQRLENVYSVMQDLAEGRDIDLELLTSIQRAKHKVKMVHFNKVLTQINALLCDVYSRRGE